MAAEAVAQNYHNTCATDADCKLFSVTHCCGYQTYYCFNGEASLEDVRHVQARMCAVAKFSCEMARKSTPLACKCVKDIFEHRVCRTVYSSAP